MREGVKKGGNSNRKLAPIAPNCLWSVPINKLLNTKIRIGIDVTYFGGEWRLFLGQFTKLLRNVVDDVRKVLCSTGAEPEVQCGAVRCGVVDSRRCLQQELWLAQTPNI
jgi:hypothetical protein